jgi:DNA-binding transcriptional ArsR family regulator
MDEIMLTRATHRASLCRLFGNPFRLLIMWSLADGELAVNDIAMRVGGSIQNISQHLSLLREHQLIESRREGRHIYYHINESEWLNNCLATSMLTEEAIEEPIETLEYPTPIGG